MISHKYQEKYITCFTGIKLHDQFNYPRGSVTNLLTRFKYKFESQTDGQFNKSYKTTRTTSSH
jgi:hypothetical protein